MKALCTAISCQRSLSTIFSNPALNQSPVAEMPIAREQVYGPLGPVGVGALGAASGGPASGDTGGVISGGGITAAGIASGAAAASGDGFGVTGLPPIGVGA